ncbi:nitrite reductase (cytochrome c-552) [Carboxydocella sporoproducens DSM 16521]|uniref:nitrite reductase (cytochrome; ammonia-forming) n=2 Tax=Carboxydocella TaxID=178898 RepID=A0A1T4QZ88_9FIRM|nr:MULTISPECIES: ammonia-forming cytochrome c nitrite reductase subunit c552 [Carboxydocella]AVX19789.1 respiratory nitrite reductase (cytochrome; ammonia-forming) precursor [Carboxydocella thermautotrophica]SKA09044.1 nitrite reductase (cytochrome c-552) [Carboxydocella sporoproducens DSM 16521]
MWQKAKKWLLIGMSITSIFALAACGSNTSSQQGGVGLSEEEAVDSSLWKDKYPLQYASYLKNKEGGMTEFGGSDKVPKADTEPEIKKLFAGYGFSKDYNEDRGHVYAVEDVTSTKRLKPNTPATCMTCKSTQVPLFYKKLGEDGYYNTLFSDIAKQTKHSIGCSDCHDPKTNELRVTRPAFIEAMKRRGIDVTKATRQEMRSYVCGQCHVEYYFDKGKVLTFPWDNGFGVDDIEKYYDAKQGFKDWEHPDSKAPMRKVQHPEFEWWITGTHGTAGVACADCHMPYMRDASGEKYSSHWWTSPLKTLEQSCTKCHTQGTDWLKQKVHDIQSRTWELQTIASKEIAKAHDQIKLALATPGADQNLIAQAQRKVVQAQWRWDWIAAENSRGFHNPDMALNTLGKAILMAKETQELAQQAMAKGQKAQPVKPAQ